MGTHGLKVYRHNAIYFFHYSQMDSYPDWLGVRILAEIPQDDEFEEWLPLMRKQLDRECEIWEAKGRPSEYENFVDAVTEDRPDGPYYDADFVYEIDLDELVFRVDGRPMFWLDCLPPKDVFLQGISFDNYGDRACALSVPEEYRCDGGLAPCVVEDSVVEEYRSYAAEGSVVPIHELLGVPESLSPVETVWTRLLEVMIGLMMYRFSAIVKEIVFHPSWTELMTEERALGLTAVKAAFEVDVTRDIDLKKLPPTPMKEGVWWVRRDACVCLATHLDEERSMHASIVRLREGVMREKAGAPDVVYGVVTSVYHIVIVRVDRSAGGAVWHTPALQFFPSSYATSASTPGITALARLGRHVEPIEGAAADHPLARLSGEALGELTQDLVARTNNPEFAKLSYSTASSAAELFIGYPLLGEYPLLSVIDVPPEFPEGPEERRKKPYRHLVIGKFTTIADGKLAVVHLAPYTMSGGNCSTFMVKTFRQMVGHGEVACVSACLIQA
ncbi:hypothetical protein BOTBODRAFT_184378 [Botryobasidium botryosum FD-172 SS1]|uniref:Uncharacterized protein n=1 Tax=Botryobasidium botryosum (strain FD-172 SS1) TaxID=930990 RepID=A0A067N5F9_BOTB1|nr:hypothetical protein BOTBODRAFT_184378 [Botryobasidium botryosum FD-172 SS1]